LLRRKAVKIPKPEIYILYNGKEKNKETEINLSKNFYNEEIDQLFNIGAKVINIHYDKLPKNTINKSNENNVLKGYSFLIWQIEKYKNEGLDAVTSLEKAVKDCNEAGLLEEYLKRKGFITMAKEIFTVEE
ncbi:MAG: hypothetical protein ACK5LT_04920, partial [Lachnospirales bacterium]